MSARRWRRLAALVRQAGDPARRDRSPGSSFERRLILGAATVAGKPAAAPLRMRRTRDPARSAGSHRDPMGGLRYRCAGRAMLATRTSDQVVDFDQVTGPLFVRAPVPGDRFDPLGMGGKTHGAGRLFPRQAGTARPAGSERRWCVTGWHCLGRRPSDRRACEGDESDRATADASSEASALIGEGGTMT